MNFNKKFIIIPEEGVKWSNIKEGEAYVKENIRHFSIYSNYANKTERLNIIEELLITYYKDCTTAFFDISQMSGFQLFNLDIHKQKILMYYNFIFILGNIMLNVFDLPLNRIDNVTDGVSGPISTADMFTTAYNELTNYKLEKKTPYGANLIFATLFEKELKAAVKFKYAREWLTTLKQDVQTGKIELSSNETDLFIFLLHEYELSTTQCSVKFDKVEATTTSLYDLLLKYTSISSSKSNKEAQQLLLNKYTLNNFLNSRICKSKIEIPFLEFSKLLFGNENLNLRNNLAHCNYGYLNYHTICVTTLLYFLLDMVIKKQCIID